MSCEFKVNVAHTSIDTIFMEFNIKNAAISDDNFFFINYWCVQYELQNKRQSAEQRSSSLIVPSGNNG